MAMDSQKPLHHPETTGQAFELDRYLSARSTAWKTLDKIHKIIEQNYQQLSEEEISILIKEEFGPKTKFWHPHKVRFEENTQCSFKEKSRPGLKLKAKSLYFIDIGPIIDFHEADVGDTYQVGNPDFENPAKTIFRQLEQYWLDEGLTGEELYKKAELMALDFGLELNEKMAGHRLGDFPHALFHRGGLNEFEKSPKEMLWVLEIHLVDKKNQRGYFFEDILGAPKV